MCKNLILKMLMGTPIAFLIISLNSNHLNASGGSSSTSSSDDVILVEENSAANVGIGTSNPTAKLTVGGDAKVTGPLKVGTNSVVIDGLYPSPGNNIYSSGDPVPSGDLFINSGVSGLTIDPDNAANTILNANNNTGNVGIGTNFPVDKLQVAGNARFVDRVSVGTAPDNIWRLNVEENGAIGHGIRGAVTHTQPGYSGVSGYGPWIGVYGKQEDPINPAGAGVWGYSETGTAIRAKSPSGTALIVEGRSYFDGNVGIGTTNPLAELDIIGQIRMIDGNQGPNKVLVSDNNGIGRWADPSTLGFDDGDWTRLAAGILHPANITDQVGIGIATPQASLHVNDGAFLATGTIGGTPVAGAGTRLMWIPDKGGALRAGTINGSQWDNANIGDESVAFGTNTIASGQQSFASGYFSSATGSNSTAMGYTTTASGDYSVAMGHTSEANGTYAVALGRHTTAGQDYAFAVGNNTKALAINSIAMGQNTIADGNFSFVTGVGSRASGNTSTAMGFRAKATQQGAIAIGFDVSADAPSSFMLGKGAGGASPLVNATANSLMVGFNSDIPTLFVGTSSGVGTTGNVGIGTSNPQSELDVNGQIMIQGGSPGIDKVLVSTDGNGLAAWQDASTLVSGNTLDQTYDKGGMVPGGGRVITADAGAVEINGTDGFMVSGTYGNGDIPAQGEGVRMMWYPAKAAFRAGRVFPGGNHWDIDSIGFLSMSMGGNSKAIGNFSFSEGFGTVARGHGSVAMGSGTKSTGSVSFALGNGCIASGPNALATGAGTVASGQNATAMGASSTASGYRSFALGNNAVASGTNAIAMGRTASADGVDCIAIGAQTTTGSFTGATAFGFKAASSGNFSTAIGNNIAVTNNGSMVLGSGIAATPLENNIANSLMIGLNSNVPTIFVEGAAGAGQTGKVGIGTTSPAYDLDINGSVNSSGYFLNGNPIIGSQWEDISNGIRYTNGGVLIGSGTAAAASLDVRSLTGGTNPDFGTVLFNVDNDPGVKSIGNVIGNYGGGDITGSWLIAQTTSTSGDTAIGAEVQAGGLTPPPIANAVNIGARFKAIGGTTNHAIIVPANSGDVGIGTENPNDKMEIDAGTAHKSGLRFTQLTAQSPTGATPGDFVPDKVLSVDDNGEVILIELALGTGTGAASGKSSLSEDLVQQVKQQQSELDALRAELAELKACFVEISDCAQLPSSEDQQTINLGQNQPNPFSRSTTISYTLGKRGKAVLQVHDSMGMLVATLVNKNQDRGSYAVEWDASDQPAGLYIYTLNVDQEELVKKAIHIK